MMEKNAKIYVAGHRGMVGSAIVRELQRQGYTNIVTRTHKELDLTRQDAVEKFFATEKPEYVFLAAAKVGGIVANQNALPLPVIQAGKPVMSGPMVQALIFFFQPLNCGYHTLPPHVYAVEDSRSLCPHIPGTRKKASPGR